MPFSFFRNLYTQEETETLGSEISARLEPGMMVGLSGDLGTGKSVFVRAAAAALGVTETMPSPTYTIVEEYLAGTLSVLHIDLYRLGHPEEFFMLGLEEILPRSVSFVEWIDRVPELAEQADITVAFDMAENDVNHRMVTVTVPSDTFLSPRNDHRG
jgi:tRNA threonylcarbamoyladenosine biosynthesis protein TsaE